MGRGAAASAYVSSQEEGSDALKSFLLGLILKKSTAPGSLRGRLNSCLRESLEDVSRLNKSSRNSLGSLEGSGRNGSGRSMHNRPQHMHSPPRLDVSSQHDLASKRTAMEYSESEYSEDSLGREALRPVCSRQHSCHTPTPLAASQSPASTACDSSEQSLNVAAMASAASAASAASTQPHEVGDSATPSAEPHEEREAVPPSSRTTVQPLAASSTSPGSQKGPAADESRQAPTSSQSWGGKSNAFEQLAELVKSASVRDEPYASSPGCSADPVIRSASAAPAIPLRRCDECSSPIDGPVFMLNDRPYCCQRHRLSAYHKQELEAKTRVSELAHPAPVRASSGLRASFQTWM